MFVYVLTVCASCGYGMNKQDHYGRDAVASSASPSARHPFCIRAMPQLEYVGPGAWLQLQYYDYIALHIISSVHRIASPELSEGGDVRRARYNGQRGGVVVGR